MRLKSVPLFLSFFIMGFGDAMGTLVGFATREFHISRAMAGYLPFFAILAYGIFSVPAGILGDKQGKKFVLMLGLFITLAGEVVPIVSLSKYAYLLISVFLIGMGMTVLQVAGNPLMRDVSAPGRYSRNLTFAQFIKGIGMTSAPYVIPLAIAIGFTWKALFPVNSVIIILTIISLFILKIEEKQKKEAHASLSSSFQLLKEPYVLMMVLGIFVYVGAEVGMNSWIATYLNEIFGLHIESFATLGIGFFLTALMIGRLFGTVILNYVQAKKFFVYNSMLAFFAILGLFLGIKILSITLIFIAGMAFGNIFPLIFSILIDSKPEKSSELSGLMCMAIVGGAVLPLLMGILADYSIMVSFLVPLLSFVFIIFLAIKSLKAS